MDFTCHIWFLKQKRMHNYMYIKIKFHSHSDVNEIMSNNIMKKDIYND